MRADSEHSDRIPWAKLALLWLAGFDLRITLLAIPPLLPLIHRDLGLSESGVAALTGLPVLMLASAAILGSMIITRFDARRAILFGIALIGLSSAMRGVGPSIPMLFAMTFIMGAGVAITQPALPSLVYHWTPARVGMATAVYTNGLLMGEVIGAALTSSVVLPLAGSWPAALAVWAIVPIATVAILWRVTPSLGRSASAKRPGWFPNFREATVWRLGITQAGTSIAYFGANTFIPDYLHTVHASHLIAPALGWLNAGQIPASIAIAMFPSVFVGRPRAIQAGAIGTAVGLLIFFAPYTWCRLGGAALIGFASSIAFVVNWVFPPLIARTPDEIHRLSAGMFTIGYALAFITPLLAGMAWDRSGIAATALVPVAIGAVLLFIGPIGLVIPSRDLDRAAASHSG
ncbi:MAG: MFS transporter [Candidatus Binataceae bacterium]|nr:MFS transporter [Candidatus Binataceae bacterium]